MNQALHARPFSAGLVLAGCAAAEADTITVRHRGPLYPVGRSLGGN